MGGVWRNTDDGNITMYFNWDIGFPKNLSFPGFVHIHESGIWHNDYGESKYYYICGIFGSSETGSKKSANF